MIDFSKHSEEEIDFITYMGGRLGEVRRACRIPQSRIAKRLNTVISAVHDLEYGYRWISAWDLKVYAEICNADIGSFFRGVDNDQSLLSRLDPGLKNLDEDGIDAVNSMIRSLNRKKKEEEPK